MMSYIFFTSARVSRSLFLQTHQRQRVFHIIRDNYTRSIFHSSAATQPSSDVSECTTPSHHNIQFSIYMLGRNAFRRSHVINFCLCAPTTNRFWDVIFSLTRRFFVSHTNTRTVFAQDMAAPKLNSFYGVRACVCAFALLAMRRRPRP